MHSPFSLPHLQSPHFTPPLFTDFSAISLLFIHKNTKITEKQQKLLVAETKRMLLKSLKKKVLKNRKKNVFYSTFELKTTIFAAVG